MKKMLIIFSTMMITMTLSLHAHAEVSAEKLIKLSVITDTVHAFFKVFANKEGCAKGIYANPILQKLMNEKIKVEKICLFKNASTGLNTIKWYLVDNLPFTNKKKHITFEAEGKLIYQDNYGVRLNVKVIGVKFNSIVNKKNMFYKIARFKIKKIVLDEPTQNIKAKLHAANFIPFFANGNMQFYLDMHKLQTLNIFGIQFKL